MTTAKYEYCESLRVEFVEAPEVGCFSLKEDLKKKEVSFKPAYCKVGELSGAEKGSAISKEWTPLCYNLEGKETSCQGIFDSFGASFLETCACFSENWTRMIPNFDSYECSYRLPDG